jgi:putative phosphoribosyl transferase
MTMTDVDEREVRIDVGDAELPGRLAVPEGAGGLVVFAHGSGSSRHSPRNRFVAEVLEDAGLATLLTDLLTEREAADRANVFDIDLLGRRVAAVAEGVRTDARLAGARLGLFGASTGAAAALVAAAGPRADVAAVVSRGGRPDLAGDHLPAVRAPTVLIVGGDDHQVLALNREAAARLRAEHRLEVVPGATHLFEEPGTLEAAADLARDWFLTHLTG